MRMHVVYVEWIDSETSDGWGEWEDDDDDKLAYTVGILLGETDNFIVVAHSVDGANSNGRISIPHVAIQTIKTIAILEP